MYELTKEYLRVVKLRPPTPKAAAMSHPPKLPTIPAGPSPPAPKPPSRGRSELLPK